MWCEIITKPTDLSHAILIYTAHCNLHFFSSFFLENIKGNDFLLVYISLCAKIKYK